MPSSFKRREPGKAKAQAQRQQVNIEGAASDNGRSAEACANPTIPAQPSTPSLSIGLRPCPFPSPVPLFSTGLASLDDLICGHGVPSSSLIAFCPAVGLTSISAEAGFGGGAAVTGTRSTTAAAQQRRTLQTTSRITLEALQSAEHTLIDLLAYGIAQGFVAGHRVLVIGQQARDLVEKRVPALATSSVDVIWERRQQQAHADIEKADATTAVGDQPRDAEETMTIAFRYAHRPKFRTTVDEPAIAHEAYEIAPEHRFRAPFDMSRRLSPQYVKALEAEAESGGGLCIVEATRYDEAISIIEQEAKNCLCARLPGVQTASEPRPLRIHLVSLGSPAWGKASDSMERRIVQLSRFLLRLRRLVRYLVLERDQDGKQALQVLCSVSVSPALLIAPWRTLVSQHLLRFFDVHVLLSDFSKDEQLKRAYGDYGGSVCLLKGPSIASLLPHGEHRSILRGGGGEAGVENDVGWRRRKRGKGIVLETLHEDVDAATATADAQSVGRSTEGSKRSGGGGGGNDIEESAAGLPRRRGAMSHGASTHPHTPHESDSVYTHQHAEAPSVDSPIPQVSAAEATAPSASSAGPVPRFQGLKSLRERGLRAAAKKQIEVRSEAKDNGKGDSLLTKR